MLTKISAKCHFKKNFKSGHFELDNFATSTSIYSEISKVEYLRSHIHSSSFRENG